MRSIRRPLFDSTTRSAFNCFAPPRNDVPKAAGRQGGIVQEHKPDSLWQVIPMYRFVPKRVPELVIDPKATGWYRIYAGLYHDSLEVWSTPHLFGKISGEKFPEFLQAPSTTTSRVAETYWKAADLTGKTIYIFQPPAPMAHKGAGWMGGISHLRLVPMSEQEVAAAKHEIELPPMDQRLFAMLDVTDEIFWNGTAETEEDIHAMIWRLIATRPVRQRGVDAVQQALRHQRLDSTESADGGTRRGIRTPDSETPPSNLLAALTSLDKWQFQSH